VSLSTFQRWRPAAEVLELEVGNACLHQRLHLRVEGRRQRERELTRVLVVPEVDVPGQIDPTSPDPNLDRLGHVPSGDVVAVDQANRSVRGRPTLMEVGGLCRVTGNVRNEGTVAGSVRERLVPNVRIAYLWLLRDW
jgi:hypothetical protein